MGLNSEAKTHLFRPFVDADGLMGASFDYVVCGVTVPAIAVATPLSGDARPAASSEGLSVAFS
jgi:hypothetical protein